jgi:flagellin
LESKLDTAAGSDTYAVANDNGQLTISRNSGTAAIAITGANGVATTSGFGNQLGTAGSAAVTTTNATFSVDGTSVTLNQNYASIGDLRSAIQTQLTGYTVSGSGSNDIVITNNTAGSAAVVIDDLNDANAIAAGIVDETGTAGVAGGSITLASGDFAIQVGSNNSVDLAGTYANGQALVDAINSKVQGVLASVDSSGKLTLSSGDSLALTGNCDRQRQHRLLFRHCGRQQRQPLRVEHRHRRQRARDDSACGQRSEHDQLTA